MRRVQIITDSCSDLTKDLREKYGIDYVKMNFVVKGEEKPAYLDWDEIPAHDFYDIMRGGDRITTTQVPMTEFINCFTKYMEEGADVVYISCSGVLSASINTGIIVARDIMEKYPDGRIFCVDAKNSCFGEGILVLKAAELAAEGKTAEEIAGIIEDIKLTSHQFGAIENLEYLRRAGRVKASSAFFGNIFGVKPILISDANGQNVAIKKVKGRLASLKEIVALLKEALIDAEAQTIYIGHADCPDVAEDLKKMVEEEIKPAGVYIGYIGPIVGASVGPGTIALYGFGKKVDYVG